MFRITYSLDMGTEKVQKECESREDVWKALAEANQSGLLIRENEDPVEWIPSHRINRAEITRILPSEQGD